MTIKQHGGIFGRNPTFNDVTVNDLTAGSGSSIEGSGSTVTFSVDRTDASTDGALVLRAAASSLSIDSDGANKDILIRTGGSTERARFYGDNGNFSIKGNLIVQTSGSGIDFSATSGTGTSELFDDYEEGTWTPSMATNGFTQTPSSSAGTYTKFGRTVYLTGYFVFGTAAYASAWGRVTGMPFTPAVPSTVASFASSDIATNGRGGPAYQASDGLYYFPADNTTTSTVWTFSAVYEAS